MMHELQLTDAELRDLALLGYLGNHLANTRLDPGQERPYPELHAALQKIYALAEEAGLPDLRISQDSHDEYSCLQHDSPGLDRGAQAVTDLLDDYDTQAAFDIVADELAERDDHAYSHTPAGANLSEARHRAYSNRAYRRYMREFEQHGFERLSVDSGRRPLPCQTQAPDKAVPDV